MFVLNHDFKKFKNNSLNTCAIEIVYGKRCAGLKFTFYVAVINGIISAAGASSCLHKVHNVCWCCLCCCCCRYEPVRCIIYTRRFSSLPCVYTTCCQTYGATQNRHHSPRDQESIPVFCIVCCVDCSHYSHTNYIKLKRVDKIIYFFLHLCSIRFLLPSTCFFVEYVGFFFCLFDRSSVKYSIFLASIQYTLRIATTEKHRRKISCLRKWCVE